MDADQAFEFDLHGVIVVKGVLQPSTVAELRGAMAERLLQDAPDAQARGNQTGRVRGNKLGTGASMLHWGKGCASDRVLRPLHRPSLFDIAHNARAVRDLLDHPKISPLLEDLVGDPNLAKDGLPSFRIDHVCANARSPVVCVATTFLDGADRQPRGVSLADSQRLAAGQPGTSLHGGRTAHGSQFFDFQGGRFYNGLLVVAFELEETMTNGGGLCCVITPSNMFAGGR
eukprot:COSAG02_NODE_16052_length_1116_cov_1.721022_1_plen_229_part_00